MQMVYVLQCKNVFVYKYFSCEVSLFSWCRKFGVTVYLMEIYNFCPPLVASFTQILGRELGSVTCFC
jgi:hypothetical protein